MSKAKIAKRLLEKRDLEAMKNKKSRANQITLQIENRVQDSAAGRRSSYLPYLSSKCTKRCNLAHDHLLIFKKDISSLAMERRTLLQCLKIIQKVAFDRLIQNVANFVESQLLNGRTFGNQNKTKKVRKFF